MNTTEMRLHGVHRDVAAAMSSLVSACDLLADWPSDDDEGSNFADNARMMLDGMHQSLEGFAEVVWARYGRKLAP